ncbi:MAG: hypothetical protein ACMXYG_00950 [Candidatus Woesearchaeota archaeon]
MAKIPGSIFIIIGILFSFLSFYLNNLQGTTSLTVFIYVGYLFIAYGVAKVIIAIIMRKEKSPTKDKRLFDDSEGIPDAPNLDSDRRNNTKVKMDLYGYIGYCPKCSTPMRKINIYCHRCGLKQN